MIENLIIRLAVESDIPQWAQMRARMWPEESAEAHAREAREMSQLNPPCAGIVAETADGRLAGFVEVGVRSYAEGCPTGDAGYIEGIWVEPAMRRRGVAKALLRAAEEWALARGLSHLGSDALIDNEASRAWHRAAGFAEIEEIVVFAKAISAP